MIRHFTARPLSLFLIVLALSKHQQTACQWGFLSQTSWQLAERIIMTACDWTGQAGRRDRSGGDQEACGPSKPLLFPTAHKPEAGLDPWLPSSLFQKIVVKHKIDHFDHFYLCSSVALSAFTLLCHPSPQRFPHPSGNSVPIEYSHPILLPPALSNHPSTLCLYEFDDSMYFMYVG